MITAIIITITAYNRAALDGGVTGGLTTVVGATVVTTLGGAVVVGTAGAGDSIIATIGSGGTVNVIVHAAAFTVNEAILLHVPLMYM
jgi:hypothetical protein